MITSAPSTVEVLLLGIFKWIVIAAMLVLIAATAWLAVSGILQHFPPPASTPPAAKLPSPPTFDTSAFIQTIQPKPASKEFDAAKLTSMPQVLSADSEEAAYRAQSDRLWTAVEKYQRECQIAEPLSKKDFAESLRQTPLLRILTTRGAEYAESQALFIQRTLASPESVQLCKGGRTGIFFSALEYHRASWDRQKQEAVDFEVAERTRVANLVEEEQKRISVSKASSHQSFLNAAVAFGLFMCIALVLIFARLEANLRGVTSIATAQDGTILSSAKGR